MSHFTSAHRAGDGPPLLCLHGFLDTWRTWELVLPRLERRHDVLAVTLAGHAGGPALQGAASVGALADGVERAMDQAGFDLAHVVGNSLGGRLALELAARGRARSVVALAPAGGWAREDGSVRALLDHQRQLHEQARWAAVHADALVSTRAGRRRATQDLVVAFEHIPAELIGHQLRALAACDGAVAILDAAEHAEWRLDAERITCPVRIVWGEQDRLLPWPSAAARLRTDWLPHADWVLLDGVGHCPQLDAPLETAQLILGFTSR